MHRGEGRRRGAQERDAEEVHRRGTQERCTGEGGKKKSTQRRRPCTNSTTQRERNVKRKQKKHGSRENGEPHEKKTKTKNRGEILVFSGTACVYFSLFSLVT